MTGHGGTRVAGHGGTRVAGHGLAVTLPSRWEARLYRRDQPTEGGERFFGTHPAALGWPGESMNPVVHLANFALPPGRGDFGTGAVEVMRAEHAFVSVVEYDAEEAGRPLFEQRGIPRFEPHDFAPGQLQRRLPGQLGSQRFCTHRDRPFCVYVVLGSRSHAPDLITEVNGVLDTLEVASRGTLPV